uniref:NOTCH1 EGF-like calcium-binding domain-containing protein n=1 Tax=Seriola lalandi dorsalis TaxID=1841481 RepID=A0A3B4WBP8_SERLL
GNPAIWRSLTGACEPERVCVNTVGSFRCDCPPGERVKEPPSCLLYFVQPLHA